MKHVVIGTAGHIDHGKTSLVLALTGIDCDRLPEERERGITIDLGFAYLSPNPELSFGIVDVPGHERFVKNMVAGTGGMDLVILVIAADEGVMPQTREHLDICRLLGVPRGVVALTKVDAVDAEWLALVREDVRSFVQGSFLDGAPMLEVSVVDGRGLDALRAALVEAAKEATPRPEGGAPRLPIDRVFALDGFGTVVTGTLLSGALHAGELVESVPGGVRAKIRGLHAYGHDVAVARAGMRTAVNLQGTERSALRRGDVLTTAGSLEASARLDTDVTYLPHSKRALSQRARLLCHLGTAQSMATLVLLDREELKPGDTAPVQLHLEQPIAAFPGDHFILRGFEALAQHGRTAGGGVVLDAHAPRHRRKELARTLHELGILRRGTAAERVELWLLRADHHGLTPAELARRLPFSARELERALTELLSQKRALRFDRERGATVHAGVAARLREQVVHLVNTFHASHPDRSGMPREELRTRVDPALDPKLFALLLGELSAQLTCEEDRVRAPRHAAALAPAQTALEARVRARLDDAGLQAPSPRELATQLGAAQDELARVLQFLAKQGAIIRVTDELYVGRAAMDELRQAVIAHLTAHGELTTQSFKELTGLSRKYVIPLQEHFDLMRVTLRVGDKRILRAGAH